MIKNVARAVLGDPCYQRLRYKRKARGLRRLNSFRLSKDEYAELRHKVTSFWKPYGVRVSLAWHELYLGLCKAPFPERFIPEDVFYALIEPGLNRLDLSLAYADKNRYDAVLQVPTPFCHVRNIHGAFYDHEYRPLAEDSRNALIRDLEGEYVVKPSLDSGGGNLVRIYTFEKGGVYREGKEVGWGDIERTYGRDYVIQGMIRQHPSLSEINASSVNTLRLMTLRTTKGCELISAILRVGPTGSRIDNCTAGGYARGIATDDGSLKESAIDIQLRPQRADADSGMNLGGRLVPGWKTARSFVEELHRQFHYFDVISWDIAIDENEQPILVELNLDYQDVNIHQGNNGPLFGEHTTEVLQRVFGNSKV